jgi:hypothetical protein
MRFSFKWMTFPILGAAVGATLAFAGCSVTSGTVDTPEGGTSTPPPPPNPGDPPPPPPPGASCDGYTLTADNTTAIGADCKACLDEQCCTEMKACFTLPKGSTDAGTAANDDCNDYTHCIFQCNDAFGPGSTGDAGGLQPCYGDCDTLTSDAVINAYGDGNTPGTVIGCAGTKCATKCTTL